MILTSRRYDGGAQQFMLGPSVILSSCAAEHSNSVFERSSFCEPQSTIRAVAFTITEVALECSI